jgi:trk system potassium uptake protein TrkA
MQMIGLRIGEGSPLAGTAIVDYAREHRALTFRIVAIVRRGRTIIPRGSHSIQTDDQIFILAKTEAIPAVIQTTGKPNREIRRVMIAGGTLVGAMVARLLSREEKKWNIKLIEPDYETANTLAEELNEVLVLNGNPTDPDLFASEGIINTDAFISVTNDEESNIISCLIAKHMEVAKTVALVSKSDYIPLSQTIGLDAVINKKASASNEIYRHVRRGKVISVKALQDINAEVIELQAAENSKITRKPLREIKLPEGCMVGGILCKGSAAIAIGDSLIQPGDRVILFSLPEAIESVTKLFG